MRLSELGGKEMVDVKKAERFGYIRSNRFRNK